MLKSFLILTLGIIFSVHKKYRNKRLQWSASMGKWIQVVPSILGTVLSSSQELPMSNMQVYWALSSAAAKSYKCTICKNQFVNAISEYKYEGSANHRFFEMQCSKVHIIWYLKFSGCSMYTGEVSLMVAVIVCFFVGFSNFTNSFSFQHSIHKISHLY